MSLGCARCGWCCQNITINTSGLEKWTTEALKGVPDPATDDGWAYWLESGWPKDRETAERNYTAGRRRRLDADFITAHWRKRDDGKYSCSAYDPETRMCTAHDDRPPVCRDFPWYGEGPDAEKASHLSPGCSYLRDLPASDRPEGSRPLIPLTVV